EPVNFDIKGNVLAGLRENQFEGRANRDPWDHLTQFFETCQIQKVPEGITEGQKKASTVRFFLDRYIKRMATVLTQWNHPDVEGVGRQVSGTILHSQPVPEEKGGYHELQAA
ncbi:hypothetical protein A2U01_0049218, partial [Trifolium medium]|nr:hypothetical protein [Trifolium medium]